jgi:outer membrane protein assembly factor BamE (lipoprotein component of BamABCDE complex)
MRVFKATGRNLRLGAAVAVISTVMLAGCSTSEVLNQGYVVDQTALDLTPCASTASSSRAMMLVILIIGFTAGPAVSL